MFKTSKTGAALLLAAIQFLLGSFAAPGRMTANAAEIKVLSSNVFTRVLDELAIGFERSTGHKVTIVYATAGAIRNRVQSGEPGDVTILPRPMMQSLLQNGKIAASIVDVARSAVGVAVRHGTPQPDVSSVGDFKRSLMAAKSISYADPSRGGATGVLVTRVLSRLGMTEEMKAKTVFPPVGQFAVEVVARGEADIALSQPMEVISQPGLDLVGLLPRELQSPADFTFSASVITDAPQPKAAAALLEFLSGPTAASVLKANGMEPG